MASSLSHDLIDLPYSDGLAACYARSTERKEDETQRGKCPTNDRREREQRDEGNHRRDSCRYGARAVIVVHLRTGALLSGPRLQEQLLPMLRFEGRCPSALWSGSVCVRFRERFEKGRRQAVARGGEPFSAQEVRLREKARILFQSAGKQWLARPYVCKPRCGPRRSPEWGNGLRLAVYEGVVRRLEREHHQVLDSAGLSGG